MTCWGGPRLVPARVADNLFIKITLICNIISLFFLTSKILVVKIYIYIYIYIYIVSLTKRFFGNKERRKHGKNERGKRRE